MLLLDKEVKQLFQRFDKDKDGVVSYKDFEREMSPIRPTIAENTKKKTYEKAHKRHKSFLEEWDERFQNLLRTNI